MIRGLSLLWLISVMALLGCKSDSEGAPAPILINPPVEPDPPFTISGRVSKGVFVNAHMVLYPFENGVPNEDQPIGWAVTDSRGRYQMEVESDYLDTPALLRMHVNPGRTRMRCDLSIGCGSVSFGQELVVAADDYVLSVGIPRLSPQGTYNVSLLTHLAYQLVEPLLIVEQGRPTSNYEARLSMIQSNSQVGDRFGVIGELPSSTLVDITRPDEVREAGLEAVKYSTLGAAILQAELRGGMISNPWQATHKFIEDYRNSGLAGNTSTSGRVGYAQILSEALEILNLNDELSLSRLASELSAARNLALSEKPDRYESGTPGDHPEGEPMAKARAFVHNLRQVASSIDFSKVLALSNLSSFVGGEAGQALDAFGLQLEATELLQGEQSEHLLAATRRVGNAIMTVLAAHYTLRAIPHSVDGIAINHTPSGDHHRFLFEQTVNTCDGGCAVVLDLRVDITTLGVAGSPGIQLIKADYIEASIQGSLRNGDLIATLSPSHQRVVFHDPLIRLADDTQDGWQDSALFFISEQAAIRIPISFRRAHLALDSFFQLDYRELEAEYKTRERTDRMADSGNVLATSESTLTIRAMEGADFNFGLMASNNENETLHAAVNVKQDPGAFSGQLDYVQVKVEECVDVAQPSSCTELEAHSALEGETPENFLPLNISAAFKASLQGVVGPVLIEVSGTRQSPEENQINNIKVSYPGHALSMIGEFNQLGGIVELDAVSQDGIRIQVSSNAQGRRSGTIRTYSGEELAPVVDMGKWIQIRYHDGEFESLP